MSVGRGEEKPIVFCQEINSVCERVVRERARVMLLLCVFYACGGRELSLLCGFICVVWVRVCERERERVTVIVCDREWCECESRRRGADRLLSRNKSRV